MMTTKRHIFSALIAATLSFSAVGAHANAAWDGTVIKVAQSSVTPAEAKAIARKRVRGGEFLDLKRRGDTYFVKFIDKSGKVVYVKIDANTGRVKK